MIQEARGKGKRISNAGPDMVKALNQCQGPQPPNFVLHGKNKHVVNQPLVEFSVTYNQRSSLTDKIL